MRINRILDPLSGERVVGVAPEMKPSVDAQWHRRLNLYTGRALSDTALTVEQAGRAGRLATRGQMMSPGVVTGLEVGLEEVPETMITPAFGSKAVVKREGRKAVEGAPLLPMPDAAEARRSLSFYHISAGVGLMATGEDVVLPLNLRIPVGAVPVYTTTDLLAKLDNPDTPDLPPPADVPVDKLFAAKLPNVKTGDLVMKPRRLGPSLNTLARAGIILPLAGVLVLQPIILKRVGEFDADDPCEQDPQNYAFEDWQLVDGCQLILYTWPVELAKTLPFPTVSQPKQWRNRLANSIFEAEMQRTDPAQLLPWEELGVPVGLVGFDADYVPLFVDRHAVVRGGGSAKQRSVLVPDISDLKPGKEAAKFEKVDRYMPLLAGAGNPFLWQARIQQFAEQLAEEQRVEKGMAAVASHFQFLPPVGLLPKEAIDITLGKASNHFFPASFNLDAVPVPLEQLDVAVNQSAGLKRFDTARPDEARILVPVPQAYYEPNLLKEEQPDPEFQQNINDSLRKLGKWLKRGFELHAIGKAITTEIDGADASYPEPEVRDDEKGINLALIDPLDPQDPDDKELNTAEQLYGTIPGQLPKITTAFDTLSKRLLATTPFPKNEVIGELNGVQGVNRLNKLGLAGFIKFLEQKVQKADDIVDFGFVRVQTDIYRYRQLMLGATGATRLATSPALAAIAQGETALATKDEIISYVQTLKSKQASAASLGADGSSDGGASSAKAVAVNVSSDVHTAGISQGTMIGTPNIEDFNIVTGSHVKSGSASNLGSMAQAKSNTSVLFSAQKSMGTSAVIKQKNPIIGHALDFRNVTVAERLKDAPAPEAKNFSVSSKYEVVNALIELSKVLVMDDLVLPGFYEYEVVSGVKQVKQRNVPVFDSAGRPVMIKVNVSGTLQDQPVMRQVKIERTHTLAEIKASQLDTEILQSLHDLDPDDGDESAFFSTGVRAADHTVAILRIVEGRIQSYRNLIEECKQVLQALQELSAQVAARRRVIDHHLGETRHDLAVARALLADEMMRVNNINERRKTILAEHVPFLAYYRPRACDLHIGDVKVRELDPEMVEAPVPACLARQVTTPPELRSMVELLRPAPVKWFKHVHPLLDRFDRVEYLQAAVVNAKVRASLQFPALSVAERASSVVSHLGLAIERSIAAQYQVVSQYRAQTAQLDLSIFAAQSWQLARDRAREVISFGDLVDGQHGRGDVSQAAAKEFATLMHVATCLYTALSVVRPVIRLEWAERISQFDEAVDLHNLSGLPRWGEIPYLDRREMQTFVDWLFSRVEPKQPEARSLINDLVRICILLASHAPVNEIVAGQVAHLTEVTEGGSVKLAVDLTRVRVGMHVLMYQGNSVVARGVIEDLTSGHAAARILQVNTKQKTLTLAEKAQVQIAEAGAFERNPLLTVKTSAKK